MQFANRISAIILFATYFGSAIVLSSQTTDGLDFLEKVENIKLPSEVEKNSVKESNPNPSISSGTTKNIDSGKASKATIKGIKDLKVSPKVSNRTQPNSIQTTSTTISTSSPNNDVQSKIHGKTKFIPPTTKLKNPLKLVETKPIDNNTTIDANQDQKKYDNNVHQIWIDEPLKLDPEFLPGFELSSKLNIEKKLEEPIASKVHPLPALDGNYSIWNSFLEFLSNYQKAFYIIGILFLFAIYRLKSGRSSSSSRKLSPTIRRMRR